MPNLNFQMWQVFPRCSEGFYSEINIGVGRLKIANLNETCFSWRSSNLITSVVKCANQRHLEKIIIANNKRRRQCFIERSNNDKLHFSRIRQQEHGSFFCAFNFWWFFFLNPNKFLIQETHSFYYKRFQKKGFNIFVESLKHSLNYLVEPFARKKLIKKESSTLLFFITLKYDVPLKINIVHATKLRLFEK